MYDPGVEQSPYAAAIQRYLADQGIGPMGTAITHDTRLNEMDMAKKAMAAMGVKHQEQMDMGDLMRRLAPYLAAQPPQPGVPAMSPAPPPHPVPAPQPQAEENMFLQRAAMMDRLRGE